MMEDGLQMRAALGQDKRSRKLWAAGLIWVAVLIMAGIFVWIESDMRGLYGGAYLIPWILLAGSVVLSPSAYLLYKGEFDLFHPLVFAAWSYIFPAFVVGGIIISLDFTDPFFMSYVENPRYNIPYSLCLVSAGFLGLMIGYGLPVGGYLARKIDNVLPKWQWPPSRLWFPGLLLMLAGIVVNIIGLTQGIFGFQRISEVGAYDGTLTFLLNLLAVGYVLLWLAIFQTRERGAAYYAVLLTLILSVPLRMAIQGSRSSLLLSVIPIVMAYLYSGRKLTLKLSIVIGSGTALAIMIGVVYGTNFRNIKGSEARVETSEYVEQVAATVDYLTSEDPTVLLASSAQALADRIDNLSSLAVVVSNYERLAPYEASYGLENNIINDASTSLVPRFLWADKPKVSDARAYGDLYFNYGENSFAMSPFGDLLRNFGPYGVPLGMMLLGLYLRIIYSVLIDTPAPAIWKTAAYFPLLTVISYETFYAIIFPTLVRTLVVLAISLLLVNLLLKRIRHTS